MRRENHFAERRKLEGDRAIGVERKRRAVENELILAADLIDIDERQFRLGDPRHGHVEAHLGLVAPIGRTIGHDEQLGAGLRQRFNDILVVAPVGPGILADRQPKPHAAEAHRTGHRSRSKHALLVEHAVIRQVDLAADRLDLAAGQERIGVVELPRLDPRRADQHRGAAVGGLARERFHGRAAGRLEGRLEHQILWRIAGDEQFRKSDDVGAVARGLRARFARQLQIAGDVADDGVELRHGNGETIGRALGHGDDLSHAPQKWNPVFGQAPLDGIPARRPIRQPAGFPPTCTRVTDR